VKAGFEVLSHTADIGIIARGKDMAEAFVNAARGMFSIITDLDKINPSVEIPINVEAPDRESLLVNWLDELNFLAQTKYLLFPEFKIKNITDTSIEAVALGEKIQSGKHHMKREIKAATYHNLLVEKNTDGWRVQVIFDI
jgi:SHS2 domain-containing protein